MSSHVVLFSHDGFGLGHVRRNALIARAIRRARSDIRPIIVTGIAKKADWLDDPAFGVVRIPSLVKNQHGGYVNESMTFAEAIAARSRIFADTIARAEPTAVIVDRHPLGVGGELSVGLQLARKQGAAIVLGLRDILDDPCRVRQELHGEDWAAAPAVYDQVLVYGHRSLCDHAREYGASYAAAYCGWVVERPVDRDVDESLVVITAGGGGDGHSILQLSIDVLSQHSNRRAVIVAGPLAADRQISLPASLAGRVHIVGSVPDCAPLYAGAGAVIAMAGYNSSAEALAAGARPLMMPRRAPRREQAIRASRLAALGLASVIDHGSTAEEVGWLLNRRTRLERDELSMTGLGLDGADAAAAAVLGLVGCLAA